MLLAAIFWTTLVVLKVSAVWSLTWTLGLRAEAGAENDMRRDKC